MIIISFKVEDVFLKLYFRIFAFLNCWILGDFILIFVAFVVPSSWLIVIFPWTKAHPAKISPTYLAIHMVTTLTFFDRSLTFWVWTHFGIGNDPSEVLAFAWVLQFPFFPHIAVRRPVLLLATFKAKAVSALTVDYVLCVIFWDSLGCKITFLRVWAPFYILIVVREWLTVPS